MIHDDLSSVEFEKPRKKRDRDRRVVSGAALEEGQGNRLGNFFGKLRGGGGSSAPSYDKAESDYDPPKPVRRKKKICESSSLDTKLGRNSL